MSREYGEKVEVRYFNTDAGGIKNYQLIEQVVARGYPFPITNVNGQPRLAGAIDFEEIRKIVDEF
ncbi:MAG: hypothetical protein QHH02_01035 [Syntrophomonadaceae bacterium]|nr:hypothetical protein [Syntrophomonadaceae bacterium]